VLHERLDERAAAGERDRPLEDHRDLAAQRERIALGDVDAAVAHGPRARHLEAVAEPQERRLARARGPGDDRQSAGRKLRLEPVEAARARWPDAERLECEERSAEHDGSIERRL